MKTINKTPQPKKKTINISKIQNILINKGYYSYDHAISPKVIRDIINAYNK